VKPRYDCFNHSRLGPALSGSALHKGGFVTANILP
jgi:hypothetical protein